jgi:flagellin
VTSILTNTSALTALQTLRSLNSGLQDTEGRVSSGLRVETASDNAAYWSIATTMRSDSKAISAVSDALGMAASKVDTAYAAMDSTTDLLSEFKSKLVAASEDGVDKAKIQAELDQLKKQVVSVAASASFNGVNWLDTNVDDMLDEDLNKTSVISSFVRGVSSHVSLDTTEVKLQGLSLFNSTGGGVLQADPRDVKTIGGIRYPVSASLTGMSSSNARSSTHASFAFMFSGPLTFDEASDEISFDVTVDADNPADGLSAPLDPGLTTLNLKIDRALVDTALGASANGVISTYKQYTAVLNQALQASNSGARATTYSDWQGRDIIDRIGIVTEQSSGLDGSYVQIANFTSDVGSGGLTNNSDFSTRGQTMTINFEAFEVKTGVEIGFNFGVNGATQAGYSFDKDYINTVVSRDDGKVETVSDMVTILQSLLSSDWPNVIIEQTGSSQITLRSDESVDRLSGSGTSIGFTGIDVNIEPIPTMNFLDIDLVANPSRVEDYLSYIEVVSAKVVSAASTLGSLQTRIDGQTQFASKLKDSLDRSIGRLVDADMEQESSRLAAQQSQQQLAIQSLSIANSAPSGILSLFQQ